MRAPIVIGNKSYKLKKDALTYYQTMLNSYNFGDSVSEEHFDDLIDLLNYDISFYEIKLDKIEETTTNIEVEIDDSETRNANEEEEVFIKDIRIAKVQYDSKCFEIVYTDS